MSKKRAELTVDDLQLSEFKAEDYLNSKASINAFMAEAIKSGDPRLVGMAEQTIKRAKKKWQI